MCEGGKRKKEFFPGTEAVERGMDCQGHSGKRDRMGRKGLWTWEPKEVSGQSGDTTITWRAHTECS